MLTDILILCGAFSTFGSVFYAFRQLTQHIDYLENVITLKLDATEINLQIASAKSQLATQAQTTEVKAHVSTEIDGLKDMKAEVVAYQAKRQTNTLVVPCDSCKSQVVKFAQVDGKFKCVNCIQDGN